MEKLKNWDKFVDVVYVIYILELKAFKPGYVTRIKLLIFGWLCK